MCLKCIFLVLVCIIVDSLCEQLLVSSGTLTLYSLTLADSDVVSVNHWGGGVNVYCCKVEHNASPIKGNANWQKCLAHSKFA